MAAAKRINLVFPDGSIVSGASFAEVEDALRASQWRTYKTRRAFRRAMRKRAELWSGRPQKAVLYQSPKAFIQTLVDAELCIVEVVPVKASAPPG